MSNPSASDYNMLDSVLILGRGRLPVNHVQVFSGMYSMCGQDGSLTFKIVKSSMKHTHVEY